MKDLTPRSSYCFRYHNHRVHLSMEGEGTSKRPVCKGRRKCRGISRIRARKIYEFLLLISAKNTRLQRYDFSTAKAASSGVPSFEARAFRLFAGAHEKRKACAKARCDSRPKRLERPTVTAVVDVEIRLSARWRALPRRHCSVSHYAGRRHDSDPDSYRLSCLVS